MFATGVRHVFTHLLLNSVAINFTFNKAHSALVTSDSAIAIAIDGIASVGPCLRTCTHTNTHTHSILANLSCLQVAADGLLMRLPPSLCAAASVENVPLRLNGFEINNASISTPDLLARITKHYTDEVLRQVYKVRGRLSMALASRAVNV
jgi:hypothetical protein